jgi:hypothetical protein
MTMDRGVKRAAALPMVLMSLGLIGALAVGGAFASRRAVADARTDNRTLALRPAAEHGLVTALAGIDSAILESTPGSTFSGPQIVTAQTVTSTWISVVSGRSAWVVSEAVSTSKPLLQNRLAILCTRVSGTQSGCSAAVWFELP